MRHIPSKLHQISRDFYDSLKRHCYKLKPASWIPGKWLTLCSFLPDLYMKIDGFEW